MLLTRRDPFGELWGEMGRLNREFNRFFGGERAPSSHGFNVWEDENSVFVETDLPGVSEEKISLTVKEGNVLTLEAVRESPASENAVWHRQERPFGTLSRSLTLPVLVDADKVEATLTDGVLRLTLPKSEAVKPRTIAVKSN